MTAPYDAFLLVSFGGPEGPDDVLPFLENVLRGRNVPRERMLAVAEHYNHFGGVSPINAQNRALIDALREEFARAGVKLPIYWGNRNWHPLLPDTLRQMQADGVRRALGFFHLGVQFVLRLPAVSREHRGRAGSRRRRRSAGRQAANVLQPSGLHRADDRPRPRRRSKRFPPNVASGAARLHGPQHSRWRWRRIAATKRISRVVAASSPRPSGDREFDLVYQSRSGPPTQPWLEPDVGDHLRERSPPPA